MITFLSILTPSLEDESHFMIKLMNIFTLNMVRMNIKAQKMHPKWSINQINSNELTVDVILRVFNKGKIVFKVFFRPVLIISPIPASFVHSKNISVIRSLISQFSPLTYWANPFWNQFSLSSLIQDRLFRFKTLFQIVCPNTGIHPSFTL